MKRILELAMLASLVLQPWAVAAADCRQSEECVTLGVLVSGEVAEVLARRGVAVRKGQLLVRLEEAPFRARLGAAEARLRAEEAALRQADRELERARELYERTLLSDYELQEAEVAQLQARARRAGAWSRLVEARTDLARARLRAPFDGRVGRVFAYPGMVVQNSQQVQPLLELVRKARDEGREQP